MTPVDICRGEHHDPRQSVWQIVDRWCRNHHKTLTPVIANNGAPFIIVFEGKDRMKFADWMTVPDQNAVAAGFRLARECVGLVVAGHWPVAWLSGPGGIGKTVVTKNAIAEWKAKSLEPVFANPANARELLAALKTAKGKRPVIMEEADTIFRSDKCLNILKIATDRRGTGIYDGIRVTAPLIIATNAPLHDLTVWDKKLRPHIEALFNRVSPVTISFDRRENWEYACYLGLSTDMLRWTPKGQTISAVTTVRALSWFTENMNDIELLSARTLCNVAEWMTILSPDALESRLKSVCRPANSNRLPIPFIDWQTVVAEMIDVRRSMREAARAA